MKRKRGAVFFFFGEDKRKRVFCNRNTADAGSLYSQPKLQNYPVDNDVYINFPVLGKIQVVPTRKELELTLQKMLAPAFTKEMPIITIRINNYW